MPKKKKKEEQKAEKFLLLFWDLKNSTSASFSSTASHIFGSLAIEATTDYRKHQHQKPYLWDLKNSTTDSFSSTSSPIFGSLAIESTTDYRTHHNLDVSVALSFNSIGYKTRRWIKEWNKWESNNQ